MYDLQAQKEIQKIRQLQKFGFQVKEIRSLMLLPKVELRDKLVTQRCVLERKGAELNEQLTLLTEKSKNG